MVADPEADGRAVSVVLHQGGIVNREQRIGMMEEGCAGAGQFDKAWTTVEQLAAETGFERLDARAYDRSYKMRMIIVRYVTPEPRPELREQVAGLARSLGHEVPGKDAGVTAVLVEDADPDGWFIAGERPARAGEAAFWLDFKGTAGTNTKEETTKFVR